LTVLEVAPTNVCSFNTVQLSLSDGLGEEVEWGHPVELQMIREGGFRLRGLIDPKAWLYNVYRETTRLLDESVQVDSAECFALGRMAM
jgi:hypothetical protein